MSLDYTEDTLVEQPAIALFAELGWETMNCFDEVFDLRDAPTGRLYMGWETSIEVQTRLQCYQSIIQVWALSTGQPLSKIMIDEQHDWIRALAFYPDGSRLASGGYDGTLLVWDFTKGTLISESSIRDPGGITSLAICPDGELLAVGGTSRLLWLWDASNFQPIGDKFPAGGLIAQLAFSRDGKLLYSGDASGTVLKWDVDVEKWIERAWLVAGRNLTEKELCQYLPEKLPDPRICLSLP